MISGNLVEEQHKIGFAARTYNAYQWMVPLCLTLKKEKEAFEYTERCKSRAFLDVLAATEIRPTVEVIGELQLLLDDEEMYLARLREIQTRHLRPIKISVEPGEVEKIYENLTHIYNEIERFDPEYVFTRRGKPLSLDDLQDILSSQKRNTVLIEYFITEEKTYIFVIPSRDHQLHMKSILLPAETLNTYLEDWRKVAINLDAQKTSHCLIEPVSEYLNKGDLIYFVPYGPLHYFPLHALVSNGEPLIKNHPVAYLPSASILPFCQNKGTGRLKTCASFGVSFEKEAEKVAEFFNTKAYTGSSATAENLETCNTDIIHLSCHGLFDDKDPLSSRIQLHDRELTARDIFNMRLTTELVTLSACETGYNERSPGDELIGLTRAFLYAGTPSVIVSLWPVYGPPTQELMTEFYRQLKNSKEKA
ncbi:MAG: CHAT domain-containing protein, partial [Theionarchaea archaeon]|nr:CHAT domain-containing protein [Theionarchaea archaeon]